jgi:hypothetical protein
MSSPPSTTEPPSGKSQAQLESYEIRCICGQSLTGARDLSPQLIECPQCRWEWFILPKSPYPAPSDEKEKRKKKKLRDKRRKEFFRNLALSPVYLLQFFYKLSKQLVFFTLAKIKSICQSIIRFFTPFRIVFTLISLFLVVTLFVMVNNSRLTSAIKTLRDESQLGQSALQKKDLAQAASHYAKAKLALDIIQTKEPYHLDIEYLARETFALTHLVQDDLISITRSAQDTAARQSRSEWESLFRYRYRSKWLIMDVTLPHDLQVQTDSYYHPVWIDQQVIFLELPVSLLQTESSASSKVRLIIAGELSSMEPHDHPFNESVGCWKISFTKESLFLWAHDTTATYLLLDDGPWLKTDSLSDTLTRQRQTIGITTNSSTANSSTSSSSNVAEPKTSSK